MVRAYYRRLTGTDPKELAQAATAWAVWEGATSFLRQNPDYVSKFSTDTEYAAAFARIECHYFLHDAFVDEARDLIKGVSRIRHIPATIVQGRYDVVCPVVTADTLARAWPEAEYQIVPDAGHSAMEPGTRTRLLGALDRIRRRFG